MTGSFWISAFGLGVFCWLSGSFRPLPVCGLEDVPKPAFRDAQGVMSKRETLRKSPDASLNEPYLNVKSPVFWHSACASPFLQMPFSS